MVDRSRAVCSEPPFNTHSLSSGSGRERSRKVALTWVHYTIRISENGEKQQQRNPCTRSLKVRTTCIVLHDDRRPRETADVYLSLFLERGQRRGWRRWRRRGRRDEERERASTTARYRGRKFHDRVQRATYPTTTSSLLDRDDGDSSRSLLFARHAARSPTPRVPRIRDWSAHHRVIAEQRVSLGAFAGLTGRRVLLLLWPLRSPTWCRASLSARSLEDHGESSLCVLSLCNSAEAHSTSFIVSYDWLQQSISLSLYFSRSIYLLLGGTKLYWLCRT